MAAVEDDLQERICNFLGECYPSSAPLEAIAEVVEARLKEVNKILNKKLLAEGLCVKKVDRDVLSYQATKQLLEEYPPKEELPPEEILPEEEPESPKIEEPTETTTNKPKKQSVLPLVRKPKIATNSARPHPGITFYNQSQETYTGHTIQYTQQQFLIPNSTPIQIHRLSPAHHTMQTQQKFDSWSPLPGPVNHRARPRKSVLPLKVNYKHTSKENEKSHPSGDGVFEKDVLPRGLWDQILVETREIRQKTEAAGRS